ncbi:putative isomerase YddE [Roseovarius albus]|uniref:Putative isomerase YddE n=1 Tax=Roseovarius albus TaxID=1247867 RepID=A0A1X6YRM2_9RHOB|nr:PhzF family phenazine biosynthesis protein [Roseovarius albus]SLN28700.1 putative isomerase YddE [Roseovarius albus]
MTNITDLPFAMYDAFTDVPYSGSQAAIVLNAGRINTENRIRIAREIGVPATSFVDRVEGTTVTLQFFSTVMELPMCGHGTLCLITRLIDANLLPCDGGKWHHAALDLPKGKATVEYRRNATGRIEVMLDVATATFAPAALDMNRLATFLGITPDHYSPSLPAEVASADFVHLCLPLRDLDAMNRLHPDFAGLAAFCIENGLETVAAFSTDVTAADRHLHVRDFCPAVGVSESAAAGTTNAALAVYLCRHDLVDHDGAGSFEVRAEQGLKLGRPSQITSRITTSNDGNTRLQVGGIATQVIEGKLSLP